MITRCVRKIGMLAVAAISAWPVAGYPDCRATSPDYTVALFELYTAEGCDSCPPADRWFSSLDVGPAGSHAAALAFHVDYWDRLGWHDRFGSPEFTKRQYEQMQRHDTGFVYTPQVLLQGRDLASPHTQVQLQSRDPVPWRSARQPTAAVAAINAKPARATIELLSTPIDGAVAVDVNVHIPQAPDRTHAAVAVALVQSGLASDVKAGENAGKRLEHDHVVRAWKSGLTVDAAGELRRRVELPLPSERGPLELVAWVEDASSGDVLQVLALPLCARP